MGIFDAISGGAYKKAAKQNAAMIQQGVTAGADALTSGANSAIDSLGTRGQGNALSALGSGYTQARGDLTAGYAGAQPALAKLGNQYDRMIQGGQAAFDRYLDATGANGAAGAARAQANFQAGPGYDFQRDQALEAIQRSAAARGGLAGGNATRDLLATATSLADQSWGNYVSGLGNAANAYSTGLAGQSQGLGAQIGASIGQGQQLAQLGQASGRDQAGLYGAAANIQSGLGKGVADLWSNATASTVANNNMLARGQTEASSNLLGGILGGATGFLDQAGKNGGISSYLTKLFA